MKGADPYLGEPSGPIAFMAANPVAANLLMIGILAAGFIAMTGLQREAWPTLAYDMIEISVPYPGANPEEVEESIVVPIEQRVRGLDDIKSVRSVAAAGIASLRLELKTGVDASDVIDTVESTVGQVRSLPQASERPVIQEMTNRQSIIRLIVHGDVPERALKEIARAIEDELVALPAVSQVETTGTRDYEVSIEVPLARLRELGLTLDDIANAIRQSSLELSAGSIESDRTEVRVRTLGQRYRQHEFESVVVLSDSDGSVLRVGDIAEVRDGFRETGLIVRHMGRPAVFVEVFQSDGERVMDVATSVREHLAEVVSPQLPPGVEVTIWNDDTKSYSERVNLLLKNGGLGLLLVLIALTLFLDMRLAVWVVAGLATSMIGAFAVLLVLGISINAISLFVFVLGIGIVVDDAIIVAEHIHEERQKGVPGVVAAIRGTRRIKGPLTFAVLTSVAAFTPIFLMPGGLGEFWLALPVVVIAMLVISLVESLFILPHHLSTLPLASESPATQVQRQLRRIRDGVDASLKRFVNGPLDRSVRFATEQPAVIMAGAVSALVLSISLVAAGVVRTTFADEIEGDFVVGSLEMSPGTAAERTFEVARRLEDAGRRVIERLSAAQGEGAQPLLSGVTINVGAEPRIEGGGIVAKPTLEPMPNVATIEFKLVSAGERDISAVDVADAWREEVGILPYVRGVAFSGEVLALGKPVEAVLSHPDSATLIPIAESVVAGLRATEGIFDVRSDHAPGVREMQLELRPAARSLGFTLEDLAQQTRWALFGAEAFRMQRDREEVEVFVRLPEDERNAVTDLEQLVVRTSEGVEVPLSRVAVLKPGREPTTIQRKDGNRVVTVTAEVDTAVLSAGAANAHLANSILAELVESNPGLTFSYGGEQQQQQESMGAMLRGFALALLFMFAMLAIPLRSYGKPVIVMAIIPFGLIGTICGHWVLGVPIAATTVMAFFGLSGVVVNDSLVMLDFIEQRRREGDAARTAIIEGAKARFRPILLTSLTTFLGFTPLILERAIQAQFLAPFAATLGVGILVTTVILMLVTPALAAVYLRVNARRPHQEGAAAI
ncbi:MAG: efflux RND transporter permease subunit [Gammaproteobacteria bacterium]|nr:efflux RND transporter permease subunit [Gammaproteobacteria bacterium]